MKSIVRLIGILTVLAVLAALVWAQAGSEALAKLGIDRASAGERVLSSLASGYVYDSVAVKAFKALPASARAGLVRAGLEWAKGYVATAEFKTAYGKLRESQKPAPPEFVPSAEETLAKMKGDIQKGIENMRQAQATANAEMKRTFADAIKQMEAQLEELDKNPQMKENLRLGAEIQRTANKNDYEARLKTWNEDLPEDAGRLIAKRIRHFLEASADVDYSAALAPRGDKMIFVKDEYEKKPAYWKTCFRAGKEATEAARAFAQAWLGELEKSR